MSHKPHWVFIIWENTYAGEERGHVGLVAIGGSGLAQSLAHKKAEVLRYGWKLESPGSFHHPAAQNTTKPNKGGSLGMGLDIRFSSVVFQAPHMMLILTATVAESQQTFAD